MASSAGRGRQGLAITMLAGAGALVLAATLPPPAALLAGLRGAVRELWVSLGDAPPPPPKGRSRTLAVPIQQPLPFYRLDAPGLLPGEPRLEAVRLGEAREDRLTWGGFEDAGRPFAVLNLRRGARAEDEGAAPPLFVEAARRAARLGLSVARAEPPGGLSTKFGDGEAADLDLTDGTATRSCLAFRRGDEAAGFALDGFACGTPARPADRVLLTCLLDRLDLAAGGGDLVLSALFADAEAHRTPDCRPAPALAPGSPLAGRGWLAPGKAPRLRGAASASARP